MVDFMLWFLESSLLILFVLGIRKYSVENQLSCYLYIMACCCISLYDPGKYYPNPFWFCR